MCEILVQDRRGAPYILEFYKLYIYIYIFYYNTVQTITITIIIIAGGNTPVSNRFLSTRHIFMDQLLCVCNKP